MKIRSRLYIVLLIAVLTATVIACGNRDQVRAKGNGEAANQNSTEATELNHPPTEPPSTGSAPFYLALDTALGRRGMKLGDFCDVNDEVARRILEDYGAIYVGAEQIKVPPVCMFVDGPSVERFQAEARFTTATVNGVRIDLQPAAMTALQAAAADAQAQGIRITPRGGSEAARRSYDDTYRLWNSRFLPALTHWQKRGKLTRDEADRLRALPIRDQVREVLKAEKRGIYFSKDLAKSILYSVAAPGTSQHIAMLALDVAEFGDARVRRIMANHGWFQTVKSDQPHFTYLGRPEKDLPGLGLRSVQIGAQVFWIPDIAGR